MVFLNVALKDMLQTSRSFAGLMFMFVIPILVTGLFFFMFGGVGAGGESDFELPLTKVIIVNNDSGDLPSGMELNIDESFLEDSKAISLNNMGALLEAILRQPEFSALLSVSSGEDAIEARLAVDNQDAQMAIIIPEEFTDALIGLGQSAKLELYKDPTLTFGPAIVESILQQLLDGFSANQIALSTILEQLAVSGISINPELTTDISQQFIEQSSLLGIGGSDEPQNLIQIAAASGDGESSDLITEIISIILTGMMIFFVFFTGAATMQSILVEEEKGTLARLFTTPNSHKTILGGKALSTVLILTVQVTVLVIFGVIVFGIDWGEPAAVSIAIAGLIIVSASTGLFLISFLKNTRQAGILFGGVLTLTGMIGLIPVFTAGVPEQPDYVAKISLLVPQGWAVLGFTEAQAGASAIEMLPIFTALMGWSFAFILIGQRRLRRRFA
jgi:ABC-2 type transport system permease protein